MKLYLLSQSINNWYDTYDSVIVSAKSEDDARTIHPSSETFDISYEGNKWTWKYSDWEIWEYDSGCWVEAKYINKIEVEYLGRTKRERWVILASFNAG